MRPGDLDVDPAVLLGRPEAPLPWPRGAFRARRVLVTGAAGSIGRRLVHALLEDGVGELRALDRDEAGLDRLERDAPAPALRIVLEDAGDVRAMRGQVVDCDVVVHAAAYKQVPFAERFPRRVALDNLRSVFAVCAAVRETPRARLVQISTDKVLGGCAVMGLTKRIAEGVLRALAADPATGEDRGGRVVVRLANVLGSAGSVLPLFARQLRAGHPLPLTGRGATRLFLSEAEAVALILRAAAGQDDGTVYAADPGDPVGIEDLGRRLARARGVAAPDFRVLAPRPGDQPHERLFDEAEKALLRREGRLMRLERGLVPAVSLDELPATIAALERGRDAEAFAILARLIAGP